MWAENFVNSSPAIQFFANSVISPQSNPNANTTDNSNLTNTGMYYEYNGYSIPSGVNSVFFFTGFSNVTDSLNAILPYPSGANFNNGSMYGLGWSGLTPTGGTTNSFVLNQNASTSNVLIGPCFGGSTTNGGWSPGTSGAIYSIYEAVTNNGVSFSYYETGTGLIQSGSGNGYLYSGFTSSINPGVTYSYTFNCLVFDIESWGTNGGSTGQDFLNLFTYIKTSTNSVFYNNNPIIIVTIGHSCSNFNGTGQSVCSTIMSNQSFTNNNNGITTQSNPQYSWDYMSPQMYTQNTGNMNEYVSNENIYWTNSSTNQVSFYNCIMSNSNINTYGLNIILPSILQPDLYTSGGLNNYNSPNLFYYQSSPNNVNPPVQTSVITNTVNYTVDTGIVDFFNIVFSTSNFTLGGYISWVNGTLSTMPTSPPSPAYSPPTAGQPSSYPYFQSNSYIWLDSNNNYWAMYIGNIGSNGSDANGTIGLQGDSFNNAIYVVSSKPFKK
jgi:hypothetical protein